MKTALVTGSTRGIGLAIGLDLLKKGYYVHFNYAHDDNTAMLLSNLLNEAYSGQFDIIKSLSGNLWSNLEDYPNTHHLDCVVLNTGITDRTAFDKMEEDSWNNVLYTNLTAPIFLIQYLEKRINPNGRIIFISSILAEISHGSSLSYAVSKAGINCAVKHLSKLFASKKVTVNAVAPGFTDTGFHKNKPADQIERIKNKILAGRFAHPVEISSMCMEIVDNPYINGQIISVDGGYGLNDC